MKSIHCKGMRIILGLGIWVCTLTTAGAAPPAGYDHAEYMSFLEPVAWWRFGETGSAVTAIDASGHGNNGTYIYAPVLGATGAIASDSNTALTLRVPYVEIPDSDDLSLVKGQDNFSRTVAAGTSWGAAADGKTWLPAFTTSGIYYSINGVSAKIDETNASATWGQVLDISRRDVDVQVKASWSVSAAGATTTPAGIVARYLNSQNHYRAELRENVGGQLDLRLVRVVNGTATTLSTIAGVGAYTPGDEWYVRFQIEGTQLRASAWKNGVNLSPWQWQVETTDASLVDAGKVGVRSANSGSTSRPVVYFDDFRVQSVGMTVMGWIRPDVVYFSGLTNEHYIHWISKGELTTSLEYEFRFYSKDSPSRPNRLSAYAYNTNGGLGAGAYVQEPVTPGAWIQIVAVFDPGDLMDGTAGVTIYRDGVLKQGPAYSSGTLYSNPDYLVTPVNGTAVLRIGASHSSSIWSSFTGGIDEVAIFDRKLNAEEIANIYSLAQ